MKSQIRLTDEAREDIESEIRRLTRFIDLAKDEEKELGMRIKLLEERLKVYLAELWGEHEDSNP